MDLQAEVLKQIEPQLILFDMRIRYLETQQDRLDQAIADLVLLASLDRLDDLPSD